MPLTEKGKKIMSHMKAQYGAKKGKEVFYASQNKGTIEGTHKTSEANSPAWLTGFVKGANALGVVESEDVQQLLKIAQRLHMLNTQGEAFEKGFDEVVKSAQLGAAAKLFAKGMARHWKPLLGATGALGLGMAAPSIGRTIGLRPMNRSNYTIQDIQNLRGEWDDISGRLRPTLRQPGSYEGSGPRHTGYFSPWGGYYTTSQ